jgi:site-specific recombinase XerD
LRAENAAPRTIEAYTLAVERLGEHLADTTASLPTTNDLRREHMEDFLNALSGQGLAAATINQRYRSLHRFFSYLVEEGEIDAHPMEHIRPPRVPEQPVAVLTEDQVRALLQTTRGRGFLEVRDAAILRLMIDTGIRRAELIGLEVEDVDLDMDVAIVLGKGAPRAVVAVRQENRDGTRPLPACPQPPPARGSTGAVACAEGRSDQPRARQSASAAREAGGHRRGTPAPVPPHVRPRVAI